MSSTALPGTVCFIFPLAHRYGCASIHRSGTGRLWARVIRIRKTGLGWVSCLRMAAFYTNFSITAPGFFFFYSCKSQACLSDCSLFNMSPVICTRTRYVWYVPGYIYVPSTGITSYLNPSPIDLCPRVTINNTLLGDAYNAWLGTHLLQSSSSLLHFMPCIGWGCLEIAIPHVHNQYQRKMYLVKSILALSYNIWYISMQAPTSTPEQQQPAFLSRSLFLKGFAFPALLLFVGSSTLPGTAVVILM